MKRKFSVGRCKLGIDLKCEVRVKKQKSWPMPGTMSSPRPEAVEAHFPVKFLQAVRAYIARNPDQAQPPGYSPFSKLIPLRCETVTKCSTVIRKENALSHHANVSDITTWISPKVLKLADAQFPKDYLSALKAIVKSSPYPFGPTKLKTQPSKKKTR